MDTGEDLNLVEAVLMLLKSAGLSDQKIYIYSSNRELITIYNSTSEIQRRFLNRFWDLQLLSSRSNSSNERFALIPDGTISDWLRNFETAVLPFIITNNLPILIGNKV
jgi:hypothetical protein